MKTKTFSSAVILILILALTLPMSVLAAAPSNDDFANATVVSQFPFNATLDTTEATVALDDPYCAGQGATVWYKFTPAIDVTFSIDTMGSNYDTTLSVYTGTQGTLNQITCNDDYYGLQSFVQFPALAGETYYVMAGQYGSGGSGGSLVLAVHQVIPPVNDDVDNAITVDTLPFTDARDTVAATTAFDDPYCGYNGKSVWYAFTPDANSRIEVNTLASDYYAPISIWTGPRGAWSYVACDYSQRVQFDAIAGQTYYIMIGTYTNGGSLSIAINLLPPPVNDDVDNAIAINSLPFTDTQNTSAATTAFDDPYCGYNGRSVWYAFTATTNTRVELDTIGSSYQGMVSIFTGPRGAWGYLSCNYSDRVRFDAVAGQTYYIMIGTYGNGGNLSFSMKLAPPPLAIELHLEEFGSVVPTTGVVTVNGTVSCNQTTYVNGWGTVQQKVGQAFIDGYVYIGGYCDPSTPMSWSSILYSQPVQEIGNGRAATLFTGGPASASIYVSGWTPYFNEYASTNLSASIKLRGGR